MPCNHINNIRNIKKYKNIGRNLSSIEDKTTKVSNIIVSNSYPRNKYDERFNFNNSKLYLNNYVCDNKNIIKKEDNIDYTLFEIAEEEDIIEIEKKYNSRRNNQIENKTERIFSNNLNETQTIDLKKLSKITSKIKEYTESKDDSYELLRRKLPPPRYN